MKRKSVKTYLKNGSIEITFTTRMLRVSRKMGKEGYLEVIDSEFLTSREWFTINEELEELYIVPEGSTIDIEDIIELVSFDVHSRIVYRFSIFGRQEGPKGYIKEGNQDGKVLSTLSFCSGECWAMIKEKYSRNKWNPESWIGRVKIKLS